MKIEIKKYEPDELTRIKKLIETDKTITAKDIEDAINVVYGYLSSCSKSIDEWSRAAKNESNRGCDEDAERFESYVSYLNADLHRYESIISYLEEKLAIFSGDGTNPPV